MGTETRSERFKNYAAAMQSVAVIVALCIGACWSLYTWLYQARKAKITSLDVAVSAVEVPIRSPHSHEAYGVIATATFVNRGTTVVRLDMKKQPFQLYSLDPANPDRPSIPTDSRWAMSGSHGSDPWNPSISQAVAPGATRELTTYLETNEPGLYLVSFAVPVQGQLLKDFLRMKDGEDIDAGAPLGGISANTILTLTGTASAHACSIARPN